MAGIISGYLSLFDPGDLLTAVMPGLLFGLVIVGLFFWIGKIKSTQTLLKSIAFIAISGLAYYVAFIVAGYSFRSFPEGCFFFGGIIGAAILLFGFHFLLHTLSRNQFYRLVVLGGALGLAGNLGESFWIFKDFSALFVIWQAGMAFALGKVLDSFGKSMSKR